MNPSVLLVLSVLLVNVYCGCGPYSSWNYMTPAIRQKLLDAHNALRQKVASGQQPGAPAGYNIQALSWDTELEQWSSNWGAQCKYDHRLSRISSTGEAFGENIFWSFSSVQVQNLDTYDVAKAVQAWYDEVSLFPAANINPFNPAPGAGHYTAVLWASTTRVGCGLARGTDLVNYPSSSNLIHIVCNYGPHGNMQGTQMYDTVPKACANGANTKYPNLCGQISTASQSTIVVNSYDVPAAPIPKQTPTASLASSPVPPPPFGYTFPSGTQFVAPEVWGSNHPGVVYLGEKSVLLFTDFINGPTGFKMIKFQGLISFWNGYEVHYFFHISNGLIERTMNMKTYKNGGNYFWYCFQGLQPVYTQQMLIDRAAAGIMY